MPRPISSVHVDIADFLCEVTDLPMEERGAWVTSLAKCLAKRDPSMHVYGARLLHEVAEFRRNDQERKSRVSKESCGIQGKLAQSRAEQSRQTDQGERESVPAPSIFFPPTREEAETYRVDQNLKMDVQAFFAHYTGNGWKIGVNPMVNWRAAMVSWAKKEGKLR